jgi:hypothetical protein
MDGKPASRDVGILAPPPACLRCSPPILDGWQKHKPSSSVRDVSPPPAANSPPALCCATIVCASLLLLLLLADALRCYRSLPGISPMPLLPFPPSALCKPPASHGVTDRELRVHSSRQHHHYTSPTPPLSAWRTLAGEEIIDLPIRQSTTFVAAIATAGRCWTVCTIALHQ